VIVRRRAALLAPLALALIPRSALADCALVPPAEEARSARHVFEGRVAATSGVAMTFDVDAIWKGNPPARIVVSGGGRWWPPADAVGQTWLVFAEGADDAHLSFSRCGNTGALPIRPAVLAALASAGLTRAPR
jgi:hypothetical protein